MGKYLEVIFPLNQVRFIAISDHYDSDDNIQNDNIILSFQNLINDIYLRDISVKIKSQLAIKRKRGEFVGNFVPYGYKRHENCKTKLVIDFDAAANVQRIFNMFLNGKSTAQIAHILNEENVLSPFEYRKSKGYTISQHLCKYEKALWHGSTISKILRNEVYTGALVQGKTKRPNFRVKKSIPAPEHEWTRVENAHDKIISIKDFEVVNRLLKRNYKLQHEEHIFSGFLICGDCGENMVRHSCSSHGKTYDYYICNGYKNYHKCSHHRIRCDKVYQWVFDAMRIHHRDMQKLTREMVIKEIDVVTIYENKQIKIAYNDSAKYASGEFDGR